MRWARHRGYGEEEFWVPMYVDVQRGVFDMDLCLVLAAKAAYFIATRNSQTP